MGGSERGLDSFVQNIFNKFAFGNIEKNKGRRWIDYISYKEMLRLSKIIPCP